MKNIEWNDSIFLSRIITTEDFNTKVLLFKDMLWDFYTQCKRDFVWRRDITPYNVLISEVMLQQTQVSRVEQKFSEWLTIFPTIDSLAFASLYDVLAAWNGLGYNRRGKFLWQAAQFVVTKWHGIIVDVPEKLIALPGIGINTAGSIVAFAYNKPTLFLETNVKAVLIHYFFLDSHTVSDKELLQVLVALVDKENPRDFYYALMDLGTWIKKTYKNPTQKSKSYRKQSSFQGSMRQIRGAIIRRLVQREQVVIDELMSLVSCEKEIFDQVLRELQNEKFIVVRDSMVYIPS